MLHISASFFTLVTIAPRLNLYLRVIVGRTEVRESHDDTTANREPFMQNTRIARRWARHAPGWTTPVASAAAPRADAPS